MSKRKGILLVILAGLVWSFGGVLSKYISWSAWSITGFRSMIAALMLGKCRGSFRIVNKKIIWIGAGSVLGTSVLFMLANKLTSAANAIVLQYAMPLVVILFNIFIRRKKVKATELLAAFVVLLGVILCFAQGFGGGAMLGDILAIISAITWAGVFISAKEPGGDSMTFSYQSCLIATLFLVCMPFDPGVVNGGLSNWLAGIGLGLTLGGGYLLFSLGMREDMSPVSAAIVANVEPVLNPTWCFLILGENPGTLSILGAVLVLAAVTVYSILSAKKTD